MKTLLVIMVLAYVAASAYIARVIRGGSSFASDQEKQIRQFKQIISLGVLATKYLLVIGFFALFFFNYQVLRYWIGFICLVMGIETLWAAFSMPPRRPLVGISRKFTRSLVISMVLFVALAVFFFFDKKLYLCLSLWDLGGVIFFYICIQTGLILRFRDGDRNQRAPL
jgi:hypothetical protein